MLKKFIPQIYQKDIYHINYEILKNKKIKLIIFDLDNTISLVDETIPNKKTKEFINNLALDFKIIVASNNTKQRVGEFCKELNCEYLYSSLKPTKKIFRIIKKKYNFQNNEIAIIGDQLVTDIFLGNRCKLLTILVDPLGKKDLKITSFNRFIEDKIKKKINFKSGVYYEKE